MSLISGEIADGVCPVEFVEEGDNIVPGEDDKAIEVNLGGFAQVGAGLFSRVDPAVAGLDTESEGEGDGATGIAIELNGGGHFFLEEFEEFFAVLIAVIVARDIDEIEIACGDPAGPTLGDLMIGGDVRSPGIDAEFAVDRVEGLGIEFDEFGQFIFLVLLEAFLFLLGRAIGRERGLKSAFGGDIETKRSIVIADVVEDDAVGAIVVGDFPSD